MILVGAAAAVAIALKSSKASLATDPVALAKVTLPLGGGTIESVRVYGGRTDSAIPVHLSGKQIWPDGRIPAHQTLTVQIVVKRPGTVAWLTGKTQHLNLTLTTPSAHLKAHFLTVASGQPLQLQFAEPVSTVSSGTELTSLHRQVLTAPQSTVTLPRTAEAGTVYVAAAPRTWESSSAALVSWFPAGSATSAIAYPAPGSTIRANDADHAHVQQARVEGARRLDATRLTADVGDLAHDQQSFDSVPAAGLRLRARREGQHRTAKRGAPGRRQAERRCVERLDGAAGDHAAPTAAAGGARISAAPLPLRRLGARAQHRQPAGRGGQAPGGQLQLALPEHPERAREHVGARNVRRDDQGRDHDVRGPARHDRRRGPRTPGLERADHRGGGGQEQRVRLHVRVR